MYVLIALLHELVLLITCMYPERYCLFYTVILNRLVGCPDQCKSPRGYSASDVTTSITICVYRSGVYHDLKAVTI